MPDALPVTRPKQWRVIDSC